MEPENLELSFNEFKKNTYEEWKAAAEKTLKGASFEKKLFKQTFEEIQLQALYSDDNTDNKGAGNALPGFYPYLRGKDAVISDKGWTVSQELPYLDPSEYNKALENALDNGQDAVFLRMITSSDLEDRGSISNAVFINTFDDFEKTLNGIDIDKHPLFFDAGQHPVLLVSLLESLCKKQGLALSDLHGAISYDPLGKLSQNGSLLYSEDTAFDIMEGIIKHLKEKAPGMNAVGVSGEAYSNGGGSAVQELAFVLATAVEYLNKMIERDIDIDDIAPGIQFTFSTGSNFFVEIAKLRAARLLWSKIVHEYGGNEDSQKMKVHVKSGNINKSQLDPYVNMLRTTGESIAAIIGGADSIYSSSFDSETGIGDDFSDRTARNTLLVLKEEAHISDTIDPAGGSWFVETLTKSIARNSWDLFRETMKNGGIIASLENNFVHKHIYTTAEKRLKNLNTRKDVLLGTNIYSNPAEKKPHAVDKNSLLDNIIDRMNAENNSIDSEISIDHKEKEVFSNVSGLIEQGISIETVINSFVDDESMITDRIVPLRLAAGFEELRERSDKFKEKNGEFPKVFLSNFGTLSEYKARNDFAMDFFRVGGFESVSVDFDTIEDTAREFLSTGLNTIVVCSTDKKYPEVVPQLARLIKKAKPLTNILVAGYPKDFIDEFKTAGVDEFIHIRSDIYSVISSLQKVPDMNI